MFNYGQPRRCPHNVVDYQKIDHFITRIYCTQCGETMGVLEDTNQKPDLYISGIVRPLTDKEKEDLK